MTPEELDRQATSGTLAERLAAAEDMYTTAGDLLLLAVEFPEQVREHPAIEEMVWADPGATSREDEAFMEMLVPPDAPDWLMRSALGWEEDKLIELAETCKNLDFLRLWVDHAGQDVWPYVCRNDLCTEEMIRAFFAEVEDDLSQYDLEENRVPGEMPDETLALLLQLALRTNTPDDIWMRIASSSNKGLLMNALMRETTAPSLIRDLWSRKKEICQTMSLFDFVYGFAESPFVPKDILDELVTHYSAVAYSSLLSNAALEPDQIARVYEGLGLVEQFNMDIEVAANPSSPGHLLERLSRKHNCPMGSGSGESIAVVRLVAQNPSTPPDFLRLIYKDDRDHGLPWLEHLAQNPGLPADIFLKISSLDLDSGGNSKERLFLFRHAPLVESRAIHAVESGHYNHILSMTQNPSASASLLRQIWSVKDELFMRLDGARARRPISRRRFAVHIAKHPNTPADVLAELAADPRYHVRKAVEDRR